MAVELPEPLQWVLLLLAGTRWPEADEDQLREMADHCRKAADSLKDATQSADSTIKRALDGQKGNAAEALGKYWDKYSVGKGTEQDPGYLPGAINALNGMGDMLEQVANSAETAKIQIIAQLGILAFELATAEAEAPFTAGASLLEVPVMIAASRVVVSQLLKKLLKEMLEMAAKQAAQMAAINFLAQGIEVAEGHRKSIDMKEVGQNALGGAVGGASAHLIGKGIGAAGKKIGAESALNSTAGKMATGAAVGVGADVSTQLITTGKVDSESLLGSGLSGGAGAGLHAGASALKGHAAAPKPAEAPKLDLPHSTGSTGDGASHDGPPTFSKSATSSGDSAYQGPSGTSSSGSSGSSGSGSSGSGSGSAESAGTHGSTGAGSLLGAGSGAGAAAAGSSGGHSSGTSASASAGAGAGAGESKVNGLAPFGSGRSAGDTAGGTHPTTAPVTSQAHDTTTPAGSATHETPAPTPREQTGVRIQDTPAPHAETQAATPKVESVRPQTDPTPTATPPVHENVAPRTEQAVPVHENAAPRQEQVVPRQESAPVHENVAPRQEPAAQVHENAAPRQEQVVPRQESAPVHENVAPRQEPAAQVHENATPRQEQVVPRQESAPVHENVTPRQEPAAQVHENATPRQEQAVPRQEPVSQPHEQAAPRHEPAAPVHENVAPRPEPVAQAHESPTPQPHETPAPRHEQVAAQPHETPAPRHEQVAAQPHETPAPRQEPVAAQSHGTALPHQEGPASRGTEQSDGSAAAHQSAVPNLSGVLGGAAHLAGGGGTHLDGGTRGASAPTPMRPAGTEQLPGQESPDAVPDVTSSTATPPPMAGGGYLPGATAGGAAGAGRGGAGASGRSAGFGAVPRQDGHRSGLVTGPVRGVGDVGGGIRSGAPSTSGASGSVHPNGATGNGGSHQGGGSLRPGHESVPESSQARPEHEGREHQDVTDRPSDHDEAVPHVEPEPLPPVGTPEHGIMHDPAKFLEDNLLSVDFSEGVKQRMPGLKPGQDIAFLNAMKSSDKHWFTMEPDPAAGRGGKPSYHLVPAWEKYAAHFAEHPESFPGLERFPEPVGSQLPPLKDDSHYVKGAYVPYEASERPGADSTIGHAEVPLRPHPDLPREGLVFTDAMNGCAFVATVKPGEDTFTAWHYQSYSASENLRAGADFRLGKTVTQWAGLHDYAAPLPPGHTPAATNMLRHNGQGWELVSQETHTNILDPNRPPTVSKQSTIPFEVSTQTPENLVKMTVDPYHVRAKQQLGQFQDAAHGLTKGLDPRDPSVQTLKRFVNDMSGRLEAQERLVAELQRPGKTLADVEATVARLQRANEANQQFLNASEAPIRQLAEQALAAYPNRTPETLLSEFRKSDWIEVMRDESAARQPQPSGSAGNPGPVTPRPDAVRSGDENTSVPPPVSPPAEGSRQGTGARDFGALPSRPAPASDSVPAPTTAHGTAAHGTAAPEHQPPRPTDAAAPAQDTRAVPPRRDADGDTTPQPAPSNSRKRGRDEDEDDQLVSEHEPKRRRTPSYENTDGVLNDRGYRSFGPEHPLTKDLTDYVGGADRQHPAMSNSLLQKVNPHEVPVHEGPGGRRPEDLNACLENVEAYRDTHFGRPRVSGQTLHGTAEPVPGNALWKRHDGPARFGEGPDGIQKLMDQVKQGGPGSFATVLGAGKDGGTGHAVALVHDRDGTLRWADLTDRKVTVADGSMPENFRSDWTVWASVADPHENNISGPHDRDFMDTYSDFHRPEERPLPEPTADHEGFGAKKKDNKQNQDDDPEAAQRRDNEAAVTQDGSVRIKWDADQKKWVPSADGQARPDAFSEWMGKDFTTRKDTPVEVNVDHLSQPELHQFADMLIRSDYPQTATKVLERAQWLDEQARLGNDGADPGKHLRATGNEIVGKGDELRERLQLMTDPPRFEQAHPTPEARRAYEEETVRRGDELDRLLKGQVTGAADHGGLYHLRNEYGPLTGLSKTLSEPRPEGGGTRVPLALDPKLMGLLHNRVREFRRDQAYADVPTGTQWKTVQQDIRDSAGQQKPPVSETPRVEDPANPPKHEDPANPPKADDPANPPKAEDSKKLTNEDLANLPEDLSTLPPEKRADFVRALSDRNLGNLRDQVEPHLKDDPELRDLHDSLKDLPYRLKHSTPAYHAIANSGMLSSQGDLMRRDVKFMASGKSSDTNTSSLGNDDFAFFRMEVGDEKMVTRYGPTTMVFGSDILQHHDGWVSLHDQLEPLDRPAMQEYKLPNGETARTTKYVEGSTATGEKSKWEHTYPGNGGAKQHVTFDQEVFHGKDVAEGLALSVVQEIHRGGPALREHAVGLNNELAKAKSDLEDAKGTDREAAAKKQVDEAERKLGDLVSRFYRPEAKFGSGLPIDPRPGHGPGPAGEGRPPYRPLMVHNPDGDGRYRNDGTLDPLAFAAARMSDRVDDRQREGDKNANKGENKKNLDNALRQYGPAVSAAKHSVARTEEFVRQTEAEVQRLKQTDDRSPEHQKQLAAAEERAKQANELLKDRKKQAEEVVKNNEDLEKRREALSAKPEKTPEQLEAERKKAEAAAEARRQKEAVKAAKLARRQQRLEDRGNEQPPQSSTGSTGTPHGNDNQPGFGSVSHHTPPTEHQEPPRQQHTEDTPAPPPPAGTTRPRSASAPPELGTQHAPAHEGEKGNKGPEDHGGGDKDQAPKDGSEEQGKKDGSEEQGKKDGNEEQGKKDSSEEQGKKQGDEDKGEGKAPKDDEGEGKKDDTEERPEFPPAGKLVPVAADGLCLLRSLVVGLPELSGVNGAHERLRAEVEGHFRTLPADQWPQEVVTNYRGDLVARGDAPREELLSYLPEDVRGGFGDVPLAELRTIVGDHILTTAPPPLPHERQALLETVRDWGNRWNTQAGEMLPVAAANALGVRLRVLDPNGEHVGTFGPENGRQVTVYRNDGPAHDALAHYDGSAPVPRPEGAPAPSHGKWENALKEEKKQPEPESEKKQPEPEPEKKQPEPEPEPEKKQPEPEPPLPEGKKESTEPRPIAGTDLVVGLTGNEKAVREQVVAAIERMVPGDRAAARAFAEEHFGPATLRPMLGALSRGEVWTASFERHGWSGSVELRGRVTESKPAGTDKIEFENGADRTVATGGNRNSQWQYNVGVQVRESKGIADPTEMVGYFHDRGQAQVDVDLGGMVARSKTSGTAELFDSTMRLELDFGNMSHRGTPVRTESGHTAQVDLTMRVAVPERPTMGADSERRVPPQRLLDGRVGGQEIVLDLKPRDGGSGKRPVEGLLEHVEQAGAREFGKDWPAMKEKVLAEVDFGRLQRDLKSMTAGEPLTVNLTDRNGKSLGTVEIGARVGRLEQVGTTKETEFNIGTTVQQVHSTATNKGNAGQLGASLGLKPGAALINVGGSGRLGRDVVEISGDSRVSQLTSKSKVPGVLYDGAVHYELKFNGKDTAHPAGEAEVRLLVDRADTKAPAAEPEPKPEPKGEGEGSTEPKDSVEGDKAKDAPEPEQHEVAGPPESVWRGGNDRGGLGEDVVVRDVENTSALRAAVDAKGRERFGKDWDAVREQVLQGFSQPKLASRMTGMTRGEPLVVKIPGKEDMVVTATARVQEMTYRREDGKAALNTVNENSSFTVERRMLARTAAGNGQLGGTVAKGAPGGDLLATGSAQRRDREGGQDRQADRVYANGKYNAPQVIYGAKLAVDVHFGRPGETLPGGRSDTTAPLGIEVGLEAGSTVKSKVAKTADGTHTFTRPEKLPEAAPVSAAAKAPNPDATHTAPPRIHERGELNASYVVHSLSGADRVRTTVENAVRTKHGELSEETRQQLGETFDRLALKSQLSQLTRGGKLTETVSGATWKAEITVTARTGESSYHSTSKDYEFESGTRTSSGQGSLGDHRTRLNGGGIGRLKTPVLDVTGGSSYRVDRTYGHNFETVGSTSNRGKHVETAVLFDVDAKYDVKVEFKRLGIADGSVTHQVDTVARVAVPERDAVRVKKPEDAVAAPKDEEGAAPKEDPKEAPKEAPAEDSKDGKKHAEPAGRTTSRQPKGFVERRRLDSSAIVTDVHALGDRNGPAGTGGGAPGPRRTLGESIRDQVESGWKPRRGGARPDGAARPERNPFGSDWEGISRKLDAELTPDRLQSRLKGMTAGDEIVVRHGRTTVRVGAVLRDRMEHLGESGTTEFNAGTDVQRTFARTEGGGNSKIGVLGATGAAPIPGAPVSVTAGLTGTGGHGHDHTEVRTGSTTAGMATKSKLPGSAYRGEAELQFTITRKPWVGASVHQRRTATVGFETIVETGETVPVEPFVNGKAPAAKAPEGETAPPKAPEGGKTEPTKAPEGGKTEPTKAPEGDKTDPNDEHGRDEVVDDPARTVPVKAPETTAVPVPPERIWENGLRDTDVLRWLGDVGGVRDVVRLRGQDYFGKTSWKELEPKVNALTTHSHLSAMFGTASQGGGISATAPTNRVTLGGGKGVEVGVKVVSLEHDGSNEKTDLSPANTTASGTARSDLSANHAGAQAQVGAKITGDVTTSPGITAGAQRLWREGGSLNEAGQTVSNGKFAAPVDRYQGYAEVEVTFFDKGKDPVVEKGLLPITLDVPRGESRTVDVPGDQYRAFSPEHRDGTPHFTEGGRLLDQVHDAVHGSGGGYDHEARTPAEREQLAGTVRLGRAAYGQALTSGTPLAQQRIRAAHRLVELSGGSSESAAGLLGDLLKAPAGEPLPATEVRQALDYVVRRSAEGPFTLDDLVTGAREGWPADRPYDVRRESWTDHGPASGLLTSAMATASGAVLPLLGNGAAGAGGVLHLTVSGEGPGLPMHRQFTLDGDPVKRIGEIEAETYFKPGVSPREVTVRLAGPSEHGQDWDYRVTARSDRSRELMLSHRRPEPAPVPAPAPEAGPGGSAGGTSPAAAAAAARVEAMRRHVEALRAAGAPSA
ncbi:toxin glutamine deamidase domain-containing protein [Kitasatospora sp. YST-16]|uniref:WXG100-like domain-containing protein n=1 Tax=Kitasatospora sp. YST-16 TaxID=2998080 RepID=UPI0022839E61|nr:toxin glutamine deamidase domain-containing protein [Kitasatospora sp. YST-16]WAL74912.1 toxin glutamine deamidase domain-containing protein [Kitasatospora sp. YST-16]